MEGNRFFRGIVATNRPWLPYNPSFVQGGLVSIENYHFLISSWWILTGLLLTPFVLAFNNALSLIKMTLGSWTTY